MKTIETQNIDSANLSTGAIKKSRTENSYASISNAQRKKLVELVLET